MRLALVVAAVVMAGCITDSRASRDRGAAGIFENVPTYRAPEKPRCSRYASTPTAKRNCDEATYLAQNYVRRLATGDEVCIDGGFGDPPSAACLARGAVVDTAPNAVLIEVREPRPDSKFFNREQHQFWFEEGALVDLYLADHGY